MQFFVGELVKISIEGQKKIKVKMESKEEVNKRRRDKYNLNKDIINKNRRDKYNSDIEYKESVNELGRKYYHKTKDNISDDAKEKDRIRSLKYYYENKKEVNRKKVLRDKEKMKINPLFKLSHNIRTLIRRSLQNQFTEKSKRTQEILGCTYEEFKIYLENQFDENMNWDNQGSYWHMDHIKPISLAASRSEVYELNHYTNFQPLYWEDNLSKGNKY